MTEFEPGDTLTTEDGTKVWEILDVDVTYSLEIRPATADADDDRSTTATYPEPSLLNKVERGELQPTPEVESGGGAEGGEGVPCTECDEQFKSVQGMKSHRSQVHTESESD